MGRERRWVAKLTCAICGSGGLRPIGAPSTRGMISDGAIIGLPLRRLSCPRCGAAELEHRVARRLPNRMFGRQYSLNASPPGADEIARQSAYADRIVALAERATPPACVLDIGCGGGALLLALGRHWPRSRLLGTEIAPAPARHARLAGLPVVARPRKGMRAEVVVSVNVIEHTADPLGFLRQLRAVCAPGGRIVLICPDGDAPWLELLMLDHRWSFTRAALRILAARAGLRVLGGDAAGGGFQAIALAAGRGHWRRQRRGDATALVGARRRYLATWRALNESREDAALIAFGQGEAAALLRAYTPSLWRRVTHVTADHPVDDDGLGRPVIPMATALTRGHKLLLAVRPGAQAGLAERFAAQGMPTLRWDGRIPR
jgi:SAM-dependent methyltransferase